MPAGVGGAGSLSRSITGRRKTQQGKSAHKVFAESIYIYIYTYLDIYIYTHIHINTYTHIYKYTYIRIYIYSPVLLGLLIVTARAAQAQQSEQTEVKKAVGIEGRLFCSPALSSSSGG